MRLLLDTDIFCKLGVTNLLQPAIEALGVGLTDCGRLGALPHMLSRGKLRKQYGDAPCDKLMATSEFMSVVPAPSATWLDPLVAVTSIDPGEAQLFAAGAEHSLMIVTGDKRALKALKPVAKFHTPLAGRIVTLDALLIVLCQRLGDKAVRAAVQPLLAVDTGVKVCFSPSNTRPQDALRSYLNHLKSEVQPLVLWEPSDGGGS